jgi:hypothetical protein
MLRLVKDWCTEGLRIQKGICFKNKPSAGIMSQIPDEYFEEFEPIQYAKKGRNKTGQKSEITPTQSNDQSARCSSAEALRGKLIEDFSE